MLKLRHIVLLLALAIIGAIVIGVGSGGSSPQQGRELRDEGPAVSPESLALNERGVLARAGYARELRLRLKQANRPPMYTFRDAQGRMCFAAAGSALCPNSGSDLLDAEPVVDSIRVDADGVVLAWRGLAADGIRTVVLIDSVGAEHSAAVVKNSFDLAGPVINPVRFEARDASGAAVWSRAVDWSGFR